MFNGQEIRVAVVILIAIICCAVVFFTNKNRIMKMPMVLGAIGQNKTGEGAEPSYGAFSLDSNDTVGASIDTSKWDLNRVNIVYDTENTPVPVPKGFTASGAEGEHTVNTGFVIYEGEEEVNDGNAWDESCTRNQFVWVPVYDTSRVYEVDENGVKKAKLWEFTSTGRNLISNGDAGTRREPGVYHAQKYYYINYEMQGYTEKTLDKELILKFDKDIESIEKYGGFYIGRYETGNATSEQPVIQRLNGNIDNQTWYGWYQRIKNISSNNNIYTSMVWGCLWDETLQWLIDTESKSESEITINSTNWGNFRGVSFEYKNISGTVLTKSANRGFKIPTGSSEHNMANNIYDLAGNVYDWTLEKKEYADVGCVKRGSYYYDTKGIALSRLGGNPILYTNEVGTRAFAVIR